MLNMESVEAKNKFIKKVKHYSKKKIRIITNFFLLPKVQVYSEAVMSFVVTDTVE